jgi:molecular chaperone DnaK
MAEIVGIDLGTTKSAIAVWDGDGPRIIPNAQGQLTTPSVVAHDPDSGEWLVGTAAQAMALEHPGAAIYAIKRFMGRRFKDDAVQESLQRQQILYEVVASNAANRPDAVEVAIDGLRLTPQEISSKILTSLKTAAETHLGHAVTQAVITVPAYFDDAQRQATRDAGRLAGLEVEHILSEPTAACIAFGFAKLNEEHKEVAVYDLGGGTFDISIILVGHSPFRVLATNGDTQLGGNDIDWAIVDWALHQIESTIATRLRDDLKAMAQLRAAAERAKRDLSAPDAARTRLVVTDGVELDLARETLESLAKEWIDKTIACCRAALADAHLEPDDIKQVLLVGGQTRMPAVRRAVGEYFGIEPNVSVNPEEVVALGAAVQGAILADTVKGLKLADVVPLTLGLRIRDGIMDPVIPRNTAVPFKQTKTYRPATDGQDTVEIMIYQGERPLVANNKLLGKFLIEGLPLAAGIPELEITFWVDGNGILDVTAKDLGTGKEGSIHITESTRLSDEDVERMIREANEFQAEDAARLQEMERKEGVPS